MARNERNVVAVSQAVVSSVVRGAQDGLGVHGLRLSVLFALLLAGVLPGCEIADECQAEAFSCDGNAVLGCGEIEDGQGGHNIWSRSDCGDGFCRSDGTAAFCALEETPDPRCAYDETQATSSHCEGQIIVYCYAGYVMDRADCTQMHGVDRPHARCVPEGRLAAACYPFSL